MKIILTSIAIAAISFLSAAQKQSVGILPFNYYKASASAGVTASIQENVSNAFVKTKRFNIVDRSKMDALRGEKDLQATEDFIDGTVVAQSKNLGAAFLVSGLVTQGKAERMTSTNENGTTTVTYKAKLAIQLKVIDVETGEIVSSETLEPKSGSAFGGMMGIGAGTPEKAISKALKDIEKDIDEFISKNFPLAASIVECDGKTLLMSVGSSNGVEKKDAFKVVEISSIEVDGKKLTRKKIIGEISVKSVDDENFSTCTIKKGGGQIVAKMESGAKLKCISLAK
ncbi:MAG: CsgG/HfaB family protein [Crocinitomicaceae bacterium]|nr:CsgG/HfaB family protein [Crocinitomicaceae bacterium]